MQALNTELAFMPCNPFLHCSAVICSVFWICIHLGRVCDDPLGLFALSCAALLLDKCHVRLIRLLCTPSFLALAGCRPGGRQDGWGGVVCSRFRCAGTWPGSQSRTALAHTLVRPCFHLTHGQTCSPVEPAQSCAVQQTGVLQGWRTARCNSAVAFQGALACTRGDRPWRPSQAKTCQRHL